MKNIAIIALTALTLSACAQQTFTINPGAANLSKEQMDMFFVGGIGQGAPVHFHGANVLFKKIYKTK